MSQGTSDPVRASGEPMSSRRGAQFAQPNAEGFVAYGTYVHLDAPRLSNADDISLAVGEQANPYPEFAFSKIGAPNYGNADSLARCTGVPANRPDHLNDYWFISLMRLTDRLAMPKYRGRVRGSYTTPNPRS